LRQPVSVEVGAALMRGGDERDAETATPVAGEIGQAGTLVVLAWRQVRIGKHADRHKQEGIAEALESPCQCIVRVVWLQRKTAVVQHGKRDYGEAEGNQPSR